MDALICSTLVQPDLSLAQHLVHDFVEFFQSYQHIPRLRAIRRTEDAGQLELVDDARGTPVPDTHPSLQQRCRSELILNAYLSGLTE